MKTTDEMSLKELVDYWTGYACIEIGSGNFRTAVSLMLQDAMRIGYERGEKAAKKTA